MKTELFTTTAVSPFAIHSAVNLLSISLTEDLWEHIKEKPAAGYHLPYATWKVLGRLRTREACRWLPSALCHVEGPGQTQDWCVVMHRNITLWRSSLTEDLWEHIKEKPAAGYHLPYATWKVLARLRQDWCVVMHRNITLWRSSLTEDLWEHIKEKPAAGYHLPYATWKVLARLRQDWCVVMHRNITLWRSSLTEDLWEHIKEKPAAGYHLPYATWKVLARLRTGEACRWLPSALCHVEGPGQTQDWCVVMHRNITLWRSSLTEDLWEHIKEKPAAGYHLPYATNITLWRSSLTEDLWEHIKEKPAAGYHLPYATWKVLARLRTREACRWLPSALCHVEGPGQTQDWCVVMHRNITLWRSSLTEDLWEHIKEKPAAGYHLPYATNITLWRSSLTEDLWEHIKEKPAAGYHLPYATWMVLGRLRTGGFITIRRFHQSAIRPFFRPSVESDSKQSVDPSGQKISSVTTQQH
ncbi:hypothetical protein PR048_004069 [Dryococelus australis]|uniref:Uncharacterized protein n=1 Tax=Dryococelus australis TaxID=614101 RepID=A0ABQ9I4I4_9NEOP|nr:hypothetical protein PR048_004069 [Dryococelus australis]